MKKCDHKNAIRSCNDCGSDDGTSDIVYCNDCGLEFSAQILVDALMFYAEWCDKISLVSLDAGKRAKKALGMEE